MINEFHYDIQIVHATTSYFAPNCFSSAVPNLVHIDVVWFLYAFHRLGLPSINSSCIIYFYDFQSIFCAGIIQLCYNLYNKSINECVLTACNRFALTAPLIRVSFFFFYFFLTCIHLFVGCCKFHINNSYYLIAYMHVT